MPGELKILTTVGGEAEAEMVGEWLAEAGIRSVPQMSSRGIRLAAAAAREIYVEAADHERALEVLNAEAPSEEELEALSRAAVTQATQPRGRDREGRPYDPVRIPVPGREDVLGALERAARRSRARPSPESGAGGAPGGSRAAPPSRAADTRARSTS